MITIVNYIGFTFVKYISKQMNLEKTFYKNREKRLEGLWLHYKHIKPLIENLDEIIFRNQIEGYSEFNAPIHRIDVGTGPIKIMLWSQMHGDESTATKVFFDIFNYIRAENTTDNRLVKLLETCTLTFIPILNPDGALAYTRENANGIDLNRDFHTLDTKEGVLLNKLINEVKPNFAFNLHDQDTFYNVLGTDCVATLSFLAPAADVEKTLTKSRREAMSVIAAMKEALKESIPYNLGRYNDTYCDSCFGDNIQRMGFPTILIESGFYPRDLEREQTRKFHFIALVNALFSISFGDLPNYKAYFDIPFNEKLFYDVRYDNVIYKGNNTSVAVRYMYKVLNGKLVKLIDKNHTISGKQLKGKYFHKQIDAENIDFSNIS